MSESVEAAAPAVFGLREVTVEVLCRCAGSDTIGRFDSISIVPAVNFLSLHGHNLLPVVSCEWRHSTDAFSANDVLAATLSLWRPSFYGYLSTPVYRRHWRLKIAGTNPTTPYLGAAVLGYAEQLAAARGWGYETTSLKDQVRNRAQSGAQSITAVGGEDDRRLVRWGFQHAAEAEFLEVRDDVQRASRYGEEPVVFAARDSDTDQLVIHGRLTAEHRAVRGFLETWQSQILLEEDPFPLVF